MGVRSGGERRTRDEVDAKCNVSQLLKRGSCPRAAPIKRTAVERQVNMQILYLFILLLILSLVSTIGSSIRTVSLWSLVDHRLTSAVVFLGPGLVFTDR